jgi:uncharacterized protein
MIWFNQRLPPPALNPAMTTPDQSKDLALDRLADLLVSTATPESTMDASTLDGFMAACLVGPGAANLDDLLPWIWDMENGEQTPAFENAAEQQELIDLIVAHWDALAATLASAPDTYEPVLFQTEAEDGGAPASVIEEWCYGFVLGMQFQSEAFDALPDELQDMLGPIFLYGTEDGWEELERLQLTPAQHEDIAAALPMIVTTLHGHFHA